MAYIRTDHTDLSTGPSLGARMRAALSRGVTAWVEANARTGRIEALQAKSDAELAAMGLRRDEIVRYVFRDRAIF